MNAAAPATSKTGKQPREDVYTSVTNRIVEALERGVRPWMRPWNAEHTAGRITRPLRHTGHPPRHHPGDDCAEHGW